MTTYKSYNTCPGVCGVPESAVVNSGNVFIEAGGQSISDTCLDTDGAQASTQNTRRRLSGYSARRRPQACTPLAQGTFSLFFQGSKQFEKGMSY